MQSEPNKQETTQPLKDKPLEEKDFIQENSLFAGLPVWIGIGLVCLIMITVTGTYNWYLSQMNQKKLTEPFLEVTNRQFSLFLWQFPNFLRINSAIKTGYLPGFETSEEGIKLSEVDENVIAPPDLIFLYHTWKRLLVSQYIPRPIAPALFDEFLNQSQEWSPDLWKAAPKAYKELISSKSYQNITDMQSLSMEELPLVVRQSFQGWKNYFKEGPKINALQPTLAEIDYFLKQRPTYARNYWRNISTVAKQGIAGENYLLSLLEYNQPIDQIIPKNELAAFLKVAMFNAQQAQLNE